jgi:hypothetical protein
MADPLNDLADHLAGHGVQVGNLFGKPALKDQAGKAFACLLRDEVAFRLGRDSPAHASALELAGAHLFDPTGKDRPMKDWVSVPPAHAERWFELAELALSAPR